MPFLDTYARAMAALRERAEAALTGERGSVELSGHELAALVHEIDDHRAELVLQNLDLRETLQELERSRNEYHELFSLAPVAYFRVDERATIHAVNDHALRLLGLGRPQLVGRSLTTIVAPADRDALLRGLEHAHDGAPPLQVDLRAHDRRLDALVLVRPLPDRGGDRRSLVAALDVSTLRRAERALQDSEARYRGLFEASHDALFLTDADGRVVDANPAALELARVGRGAVLGRELAPLLTTAPPLDWQALRASDRHAPPRELEVTRGDDVPRLVELAVTPSPGEPEPRYLVALRDITERRRAEQAQRALEEERRQSQRLDSLGRLAGGIAHDMNNVLATILGLATVLERDATSPEMLDDLRTLVGAATRGHDLMRKLLAFARRGSSTRTTVRLGDVVGDIAGLLRHTHSRSLRVEVDVPAAPVLVHANASELGQVLLNVALNAIDAMNDGGTLSFRLRLEGPLEARRAALEVRDTGTGMDPETLDRAFEPFFTTKPQGKGVGLGLSTVYGIVREHGGAVRLHSGAAGGTIVQLTLPALGQPPGPAGPTRTAPQPGRLRVLVVDDEPAVLDVTCRVLRNVDHAAEPAQSGGEALYFLEHAREAPDVVLLDIDMPRMNGVETARRILERWPDQAIVFMSGLHDGEATSLAVRGTRGFVAKPFTLAELTAALGRAKAQP
jgi:PAS domain S-box-containing protein